MEVAPRQVVRTFTAPINPHPRLHSSTSTASSSHHSLPSSQYSFFTRPSRSSDSTQDSTTSSSHPVALAPSFVPQNGGVVGPSDNVINRVADRADSLFQVCVGLREQLQALHSFDEQYKEVERNAEDSTDPVNLLWTTLKRGYPLMTVYNALRPEEPLVVDETKVQEAKREKTATIRFLHACIHQLNFPPEQCFILKDLYGEDINGFVKVVTLVNRVAELLVQRKILSPVLACGDQSGLPMTKRTIRQHIVNELVTTERTYVQHLEYLQAFRKLVEEKGVISGDSIYDIFLNLNGLLDFQRRFLIRVEQCNALPEAEQNWGRLFSPLPDGFNIYETYIGNQKKCEVTALREYEKLREAGGPVELRQMIAAPTSLPMFLVKPFQRLSKYPLLLGQLRDKGDLDTGRLQDVHDAIEAVQNVLERCNELIRRQEKEEVVEILKTEVEDWKGHRVEGFGDLLLHGKYTVLKNGDVTDKSAEREYRMYLFEKILLCCKEINPDKPPKNRMNKPPPPAEKGQKLRLALKGRIFMQNVTQTLWVGKPGNYTCQIFWRGDETIEFFTIRFATEEIMNTFHELLDTARRVSREQMLLDQSGASDIEFAYMKEHGNLQNPYRDYEHTEGMDAFPARFSDASYSMSRNASSTNLRSRSTTAESGRGPVSKNSMGFSGISLTLRTQQLSHGPSPPGEGDGSWFSPTVESPMSSRTSNSSGMFPFPRQASLQGGGQGDEQNRFTAPALGRSSVRDITTGHNAPEGRGARAGSGISTHPASFAQNRLRSASSPDVHETMGTNTKRGAPPVPQLPSYLANNSAVIQRSQNNSPVFFNGANSRATNRSPVNKKTTSSQQGTYGMSQVRREQGHASFDDHASLADSSRTLSPTVSMSSGEGGLMPSQLKIKVKVPSEGSTMTLVVSSGINYETLRDRIDAKLARATSLSIALGTVKLRYLLDDDFVSITQDEDVQTAFETWREQQQGHVIPGHMGELELFCHI